MSKGLTVVFGDFDRARAEGCGKAMEDRGMQVIQLESGTEVLERCREDPPEVAVLEVLLPRKNGFETLKALKEDARTASIKVVLVMDEDDEYSEHRARLCGADAIRRRPFTAEDLAETVRACMQESGLEAAERDAQSGERDLGAMLEAMEGRAKSENPLLAHITDSLTGLFNAPYMELKLAEEFKKARRFDIPLSGVSIAFDDSGALAAPDHTQELRSILNEVAGVLLCESRDIDHLARQNVSEFFLLLPHTDSEGAAAMAGRILASIEGRGFETNGTPMTASAGIATFTGGNAESSDQMTDRCQEALTASRRWGGNRVTVWTPDTESASRP